MAMVRWFRWVIQRYPSEQVRGGDGGWVKNRGGFIGWAENRHEGKKGCVREVMRGVGARTGD